MSRGKYTKGDVRVQIRYILRRHSDLYLCVSRHVYYYETETRERGLLVARQDMDDGSLS